MAVDQIKVVAINNILVGMDVNDSGQILGILIANIVAQGIPVDEQEEALDKFMVNLQAYVADINRQIACGAMPFDTRGALN